MWWKRFLIIIGLYSIPIKCQNLTTAKKCSYCHGEGWEQTCPCGAAYHIDCWQHYGKCVNFGCNHKPPIKLKPKIRLNELLPILGPDIAYGLEIFIDHSPVLGWHTRDRQGLTEKIAYKIWEHKGKPSGTALRDWVEAEMILKMLCKIEGSENVS